MNLIRENKYLLINVFMLVIFYIFWMHIYQYIFPQGEFYRLATEDIMRSVNFYTNPMGSSLWPIVAVFFAKHHHLWQILMPLFICILAYITFYVLIGRHPNQINDHLPIITMISLPLFLNAKVILADIYFWTSGTCGYLLPCITFLIGIIPIVNFLRNKKTSRSIYIISALCLFISNHFLSLAVIGIFWLYSLNKQRKVTAYMWVLLAVAIGICIFFIFTPGNFSRASHTMDIYNQISKGIYKIHWATAPCCLIFGIYLSFKTKCLTGKFKILHLISIIATFLWFLLYLSQVKFTLLNANNYIPLMMILFCLYILVAFILFMKSGDIGTFIGLTGVVSIVPAIIFNSAPRGLFYAVFAMVCIIVMQVSKIKNSTTALAISLSFVICLSFSYLQAIQDVKENYIQYQKIMEQIEFVKQNGKGKVTFPKWRHIEYLNSGTNHMKYNKFFADYYGIPSESIDNQQTFIK